MTTTPLLASTERAALLLLARAQSEGRLPSVVAGVVRDGAVAWSARRGSVVRTDGAPGEPDDTHYKIGSVTKTFTGALVMLAREQGELGLEDRVGRFLPDGPFADATVRQLLSHTAGISAEPRGTWWERSEGGDRAALVAAHADAATVLEPGSVFHYSNTGFGVLGEVVAEVTGGSWWAAVEEQLLRPLGMDRTSYQWQPEGAWAQGWSVDALTGGLAAEPLPDTGAMAPAGQLWSTVGDLATWLTALVDPDRSVLRAESLLAMRTPTGGTPEDRAGAAYGLGLQTWTTGGRMYVGHGGSMPGFQCGVMVDVDSRVGSVVLSNGGWGLGPATRRLLDLVLDREPPLPPEWVPTTGPVPDAVRDVLGTWHWGHAPSVARWDGARLRMAPPSGPGRVLAFAPTGVLDEYVGTAGYLLGETLRAVRRPDGSVSHLECATFVLTRVPYDPAAPIPGGTGHM